MIVAIVAHVDAGKTTLSEAMLYETGQIRRLGRVDHQDAYLDTDPQERERGITIFSKQARMRVGGMDVTLLDTPGHVDFSAEMERTLSVVDYAILVISGTDGVQGHTRTLWRLLGAYGVPVFIFVNKMDLPGADRENVAGQLGAELSDGFVDFSDGVGEAFFENLALCDEGLLNTYMESGEIPTEMIRDAIAERRVFPCYYGSALKVEGVDSLLHGMEKYMKAPSYPDGFAAQVYKIGRDVRGMRLTYMKITGGTLSARDLIDCGGQQEKVDQIRLYSGEKYESVPSVSAGEACAVTGLSATHPGMGLGAQNSASAPILEPILNYQVMLPSDVHPAQMLEKLRELEDEDPQLHVVWNERLREIHVQMMGEVQTEVLAREIYDRFGIVVTFGQGSILYKETIARPVEGVGHFEPLRHYAEAHLLIEPGEPGSGIEVATACSTDVLAANWQKQILSCIGEKEHLGVLTGSPLTDVRLTLLGGRAHEKHTEGGDFRQATWRAIRQGLKSAESVLLEPMYDFLLELPQEMVGRAMTDIRQRFGDCAPPEFSGDAARLSGTAPVSTMRDYAAEVNAYTGGLGRLTLTLSGYGRCHNADEVIAEIGYDSEADLDNPTGSVFCAHGAGFVVPWDEVKNYMHIQFLYEPPENTGIAGTNSDVSGAAWPQFWDEGEGYGADEAERLAGNRRRTSWEKSVASMSASELDQELKDVYAREFGLSGEEIEERERRRWGKSRERPKPAPAHVKLDRNGNPILPPQNKKKRLLVVDGYNIIFAWKELRELSETNIDAARDRLKDILCNYQGYVGERLIVVFDAYRRKDNAGRKEFYDGIGRRMEKVGSAGIEVVYTRTDETADAYIERLAHEVRDKYQITVATNDGLEQLTVLSQGALRMSADNLHEEVERTNREGLEKIKVAGTQ
ncbi:MAG: NYN domain-containing protein [Clostridiales bacterium]|nr:NYN domain-containing protein [Clostridiales bacterium]